MDIEIYQMIEMIENHFEHDWDNPKKILTVGGMVGTSIFKHAIHACMKTFPFQKILIVEGCQDYIGLLRKPVFNYFYYMSLFSTVEVPDSTTIMNPHRHYLVRRTPEYQTFLNDDMIYQYDALIINNAHLIPGRFRSSLTTNFQGKVLQIVDPFDIYGELYSHVPTITDTLSRQSSVVAFARSMYGVETRSVDRKARCDIKKVKIARRSIGKIDDKQYVTISESIANQIRDKQRKMPFRRHQKYLLDGERIFRFQDQNQTIQSIGKDSLISIVSAVKPLMKLRIHSSASNLFSNISYQDDGINIYAKPANIMTLDEAVRHRFQSVVMVLGDEPVTERQWYSLLKIANNITITDF